MIFGRFSIYTLRSRKTGIRRGDVNYNLGAGKIGMTRYLIELRMVGIGVSEEWNME